MLFNTLTIRDWQDNFERDKIATYDEEKIWLRFLRQGCPEQQSGQFFQEPGEYHSPTKPAYPADENRRRDSQASTVHQVQARGPGGREGDQTGRSSSDMRVERLILPGGKINEFMMGDARW